MALVQTSTMFPPARGNLTQLSVATASVEIMEVEGESMQTGELLGGETVCEEGRKQKVRREPEPWPGQGSGAKRGEENTTSDTLTAKGKHAPSLLHLQIKQQNWSLGGKSSQRTQLWIPHLWNVKNERLCAPQGPVSVVWVQHAVYSVCVLRQQCRMQKVLVPKPASAACVLKIKSSLAGSHVRRSRGLLSRAH